ncbi:MAG: sugar phosphate isomerase/epimerase [Chloroflexota bacterium]|nr:sugar phosphate isomerase/epimerase [Chloroflexota bacterium]
MKQIGLQLYSVRTAIERNFEDTIRKVAAMGYKNVETAFFPEHISLARAGKLFNELGLNVVSAHCEIPSDDQQQDLWLEMAEVYDCQNMIWHGWAEDGCYKSVENTKQWVEIYNEASVFAKANGLRLGLHNHWWEFEEADDGHLPFYYFLEHLDSDIFFEIDIYWAKVAGKDPAKIVADFGDRVSFLHVKDGPARTGETDAMQLPAGQGTLDIPAILQASSDDTEWLIVEFDHCATDVLDAVQESYRYLTEDVLV